MLARTLALALGGALALGTAPAPLRAAPAVVDVQAARPAATLPAPTAAPNPVVEALRDRIDAIRAAAGSGEASRPPATPLRATRTLPQLYQMNGFQPLWDHAPPAVARRHC
jgi:hypothetical protein